MSCEWLTNPDLDPLEAITDLLRSGHGPEIAFKTKDGNEVRFFFYDSEAGGLYDDLEGGLYILFDEDDLWERKPTTFLKKLKAKGYEPEESSWTVFG